MAKLENLYLASPVWAQQIAVASYGLWWQTRRFGGGFSGYVEQIEARDRWTYKQHRAHQEALLTELLTAARLSPYYREVFENAGIEPQTPPLEALSRLPLLTKQTLRQRGRDLVTAPVLPRSTAVFKSSGTTGTPTEIYFDPEFHRLVQAFFEVRIRNWAGVTHRDRRAMFGVRKVCRFDQSRPPFWRRSPAEKLAYFSIYHLSPANLAAYIAFLNEFHPTVVMGYPNSLATIARFALENDVAMRPARAVITTSETVTAEIRKSIEAAWGCTLFDNYCAVEACVLASQCEAGSYHVSPDFGILEILDPDGNPCPPGVIGRAVCTGLHNRLQPLIRYEIGDALRWAPDPCRCGREMPAIEAIEGRIEDICYTADGRELLRFDTVFKGVESIREAQVEQTHIDRFVIRIVPTGDFSAADESLLRENMKLHVGEVTIRIELIDAIARTPTGKFRPVISRVSRPRQDPDETDKQSGAGDE